MHQSKMLKSRLCGARKKETNNILLSIFFKKKRRFILLFSDSSYQCFASSFVPTLQFLSSRELFASAMFATHWGLSPSYVPWNSKSA